MYISKLGISLPGIGRPEECHAEFFVNSIPLDHLVDGKSRYDGHRSKGHQPTNDTVIVFLDCGTLFRLHKSIEVAPMRFLTAFAVLAAAAPHSHVAHLHFRGGGNEGGTVI